MSIRFYLLLLTTFLAFGSASVGFATNGVLEINQTCAVQTGCFAGDTPGFPVTINASGSYRLTSSLTGVGANTDGIFVNTSFVTLDLNGFAIRGPAIGTGSGNGITGGGTNGSFAGFTTIRNGSIRGFRQDGISLAGADGVRVKDMVVQLNSERGVHLGDNAHVSGNRIDSNGNEIREALYVGDSSIVIENVVTNNNGDNIFCLRVCTIMNNTVNGGGGDGIVAANRGSTIMGNTSVNNAGRGIDAGVGSTVVGNTVSGNGGGGIRAERGATVSNNSSYQNVGVGISTSNDAMVEGNTVTLNSSYGLTLATGTTYRNNTINDNGAIPVLSGIDMGGNSCDNTSTCP